MVKTFIKDFRGFCRFNEIYLENFFIHVLPMNDRINQPISPEITGHRPQIIHILTKIQRTSHLMSDRGEKT